MRSSAGASSGKTRASGLGPFGDLGGAGAGVTDIPGVVAL
jgi:hypothetical protein